MGSIEGASGNVKRAGPSDGTVTVPGLECVSGRLLKTQPERGMKNAQRRNLKFLRFAFYVLHSGWFFSAPCLSPSTADNTATYTEEQDHAQPVRNFG